MSKKRSSRNLLLEQGWKALPDVALVEIYSLLKDQDRARMARVCQNWFRMFSYPSLWRYRRVKFGGFCADDTGKNAWKFAKLFAKHVRSLTLGFGMPSFRTVKIMSKSAETFLRKLGALNNLKIQCISIEYLNMEYYWHFIISRNRIVTALSRFFKRQRCLLSINLIAARLTLIDGCRILESLGRGASGRTLESIYMEDMFQANVLPFRHRRYINAMRKFTGLRFVHTNYSYLSNELLEIFSDKLGMNLQRMTIMIDSDVSTHSITTAEWNNFVAACPSLRIGLFVCSFAPRSNISSVLVRGIPIDAVHISIWKTLTDENPNLISNMLDHVGNTYYRTLESLELSLDRNPSIDEPLLNALNKCRQIRCLAISGQISVQTIQDICRLQEEGRVDLHRLNLSLHGMASPEYPYLMSICERLKSSIDGNAVVIETNLTPPPSLDLRRSPSTDSDNSSGSGSEADIETSSDSEEYRDIEL
ncbi:hypothetical protein ScPMuIL_005257 [Solemya velum]